MPRSRVPSLRCAEWGLAMAVVLVLARPSLQAQTVPAPALSIASGPDPRDLADSAQVVLPSAQFAGGASAPGGLMNAPILTIKELVRMSPSQLEQLYRQGSVPAVPSGRVNGRAILYPGTKLAAPASSVARFMWQGKVFCPQESTAVNRFFGIRAIRGNLYYAESWYDGNPALILDYKDTSKIYAANRDEIREVAPGLFLGLMYERTQPQPTFKMFFALTTQQ